MYHLEGLPAACLLHGVDDPDGLAVRTGELPPFSQSVQPVLQPADLLAIL